MRPLASTSWAYIGNVLARKCSQTTYVTENDLMCMDILMDASQDPNCPEGKDTIRRVSIILFHTYGEEPPISVDNLKAKLFKDFNLKTTSIENLNGTLAVIGTEYINLSDYQNKIGDVPDKLIPYNLHHKTLYSKIA